MSPVAFSRMHPYSQQPVMNKKHPRNSKENLLTNIIPEMSKNRVSLAVIKITITNSYGTKANLLKCKKITAI
jgi:hypothetical protein